MKPDLRNQNILITGAGRGLGQHLSLHLASCGATIGVADIDAASAEATVSEIQKNENRAFSFTGDMSKRETFMQISDDFADRTGRIDAIINNAMMLYYCPVEKVEEDKLSIMIDIGIKAVFWASQALLKHYDPARGACMINMSSPVAHRGYPNTSIYAAVKGGITTLTKELGAELGPKGIRVNAVSPASVPTPGALGLNSKEEYEKRAANIPLRRNGTEEDNSSAIAFLLSKEASFVNGEIFNVDGGVAASA